MQTWPTSVTISASGKNDLISMLQESYKRIYGEMSQATSFGVANRQVILGQVRSYLKELGANLDDFTQSEIPDYYKQGANQAVAQLQKIGADINVATGFNRIHKQAISALVSDTASSFADAIQGVNRTTTRLLNTAVKQQLTQDISKGLTSGEALRDVKKTMVATLQDQGLSALVDRGGKTWSLDTYAEMLYRTKAVEARNLGMINRMTENGYDLVQVSAHGALDQCAPWEGRVLSTTGETTEFNGEEVPTVQDAIDAGLFHPNCKHAINAIAVDLANQTQAYNTETGKYEPGGGLTKANASLFY